MNERLEYIFNPQTLISIVVTVIWMAVAWTSLKAKVDQLERDVREIQWFHLDVEIAEIKKDIQYMREMLERLLQQMK